MPQPTLINGLAGVIGTDSTKWPGLIKVLHAPVSAHHRLEMTPGSMVIYQGGDKTIFIPKNLFEAGQRGGVISEYETDTEALATPSGLPLDDDQLRMVSFFRQTTPQWEGALLAAAPGTGKTLPTLHALWLDGFLHRNGLVCAPAGATTTWCDPIMGDPRAHYGLTVTELQGENPDRTVLANGGWFFCNYDILYAWASAIKDTLRPAALVFDEVHELSLLMNSEKGSRRAWAAHQLSKAEFVERRYGLTGTPIKKSRMDLHGQMSMVQPRQWGSRHQYGHQYMGLEKTTLDSGKSFWVETRPTNGDELRARLAGCFLRYKRRNVAGMPTLIRHKVPVKLDEGSLEQYYRVTRDPLGYLADVGKIQAGEKIKLGKVTVDLGSAGEGYKQAINLIRTSLQREVLADGKAKHTPQVAWDLASQHKNLVVFCWMRREAKQVAKLLREMEAQRQQGIQIFGSIDGSDVVWKRQHVIRDFVRAPRAILVCTRDSVKISINEMALADACLQTGADYNPSAILQTEGRLNRKCSPHAEVHSYYMMVDGTLDDRILELLWSKAEEAQDISPEDREGLKLAAALEGDEGSGDELSFEDLSGVLDVDSEDPYRLTRGL